LRRARYNNTPSVCDIDKYLDSEPVEWDIMDKSYYSDDWVLNWYKSAASQYPSMAAAARAILAIPGSEVDVERLFCGGRDLLGIRRHIMSGELMRILTLLKAWFERQIAQNKVKGEALLPEVKIFSICLIRTV
jgi:hypothetical protein